MKLKEEIIQKERQQELTVWATEKRSLAVVWKNVRKMRSRERQSEIMDWSERSNCDTCAINETGCCMTFSTILVVNPGSLGLES